MPEEENFVDMLWDTSTDSLSKLFLNKKWIEVDLSQGEEDLLDKLLNFYMWSWDIFDDRFFRSVLEDIRSCIRSNTNLDNWLLLTERERILLPALVLKLFSSETFKDVKEYMNKILSKEDKEEFPVVSEYIKFLGLIDIEIERDEEIALWRLLDSYEEQSLNFPDFRAKILWVYRLILWNDPKSKLWWIWISGVLIESLKSWIEKLFPDQSSKIPKIIDDITTKRYTPEIDPSIVHGYQSSPWDPTSDK